MQAEKADLVKLRRYILPTRVEAEMVQGAQIDARYNLSVASLSHEELWGGAKGYETTEMALARTQGVGVWNACV